jgi:hypothetical protein
MSVGCTRVGVELQSNFIMKSLMILLLIHHCASDKIEKNEIGWACSSDGGQERRVQGFGGET